MSSSTCADKTAQRRQPWPALMDEEDKVTGFSRLAFAGLILFAGLSAALAGDWPPNEQLAAKSPTIRSGAWFALKGRFGIENLTDQAFLEYAALLAERDCAGAADLVLASHRLSDTEFAVRAADPAVEAAWRRTVVPSRFPGIGLCQRRVRMEQAILTVMGDGPPDAPVTAVLGFANRINTDAMPFHVGMLIDALQIVFNHASVGNPDAIRYLLNEVQAGGFIALTGEQRLALLMRLDALGVASESEQTEAKKLAETLNEAAIAKAQKFARREFNSGFERWQIYQKRIAATASK